MILIRPRVSHIPWLSFSHTSELIAVGYRPYDVLNQAMEELARPAGDPGDLDQIVGCRRCVGTVRCTTATSRYSAAASWRGSRARRT